MPNFQTIDTLSLTNKIVLLRADLNVPTKNGAVTDRARLERLVPTLRDLKKAQAKVVVMSHFGRPKAGQRDVAFSLRPIAIELGKVIGEAVFFADDCVGDVAKAAIKTLMPGQILVLENTRFHKGEEENDPAFAKELAALGDVYINDAFSAAHRAHASTEGIAHLLPHGAGRLMQAELEALAKSLSSPVRPVMALVGGSKISTKLDLLHNLITKVDKLVLGGGMANTFVAAQGAKIGLSLCEADMFATAREIAVAAQKRGCQIILPKDAVVAAALQPDMPTMSVAINKVPDDQMILDLGPLSVQEIQAQMASCKTVIWNGPLGAFETKPFDAATNEVARSVAEMTQQGKILSVAGGGDTVAAMANAGVSEQLSYLSTAGGAFLEWLEGKKLPGVAALEK